METLVNIDEQLYMMINSGLSNGFFDIFLVPLRHKLCWIPLYLFLLSFIILNYRKQTWLVIVSIAIVIALSDTMSSQIIKKNVQRIRPCHQTELHPIQRVPCSNGYSFTSSHATNHMALGTFFFLLFPFFKKRWLLYVWVGLVCLGQIYVGVHYPFDILGGVIVGGIIGFSVHKMYRWISNRYFSNQNLLA